MQCAGNLLVPASMLRELTSGFPKDLFSYDSVDTISAAHVPPRYPRIGAGLLDRCRSNPRGLKYLWFNPLAHGRLGEMQM
jgi:hypothetical protein